MTSTTPVPAGACDCHIHIYDDAQPLAPSATFKPPHAPLANYRRVQSALGLQRVVLVQPTGYARSLASWPVPRSPVPDTTRYFATSLKSNLMESLSSAATTESMANVSTSAWN